jgi:hypothetical protein
MCCNMKHNSHSGQTKRGYIKGNMKIKKLRGILRLSKRKDSRSQMSVKQSDSHYVSSAEIFRVPNKRKIWLKNRGRLKLWLAGVCEGIRSEEYSYADSRKLQIKGAHCGSSTELCLMCRVSVGQCLGLRFNGELLTFQSHQVPALDFVRLRYIRGSYPPSPFPPPPRRPHNTPELSGF